LQNAYLDGHQFVSEKVKAACWFFQQFFQSRLFGNFTCQKLRNANRISTSKFSTSKDELKLSSVLQINSLIGTNCSWSAYEHGSCKPFNLSWFFHLQRRFSSVQGYECVLVQSESMFLS
jgi:hypothetical protein